MATGSGKTWIAYLLYRWYSKKTLVIVPTVGLCSQSSQDFIDYGCPDNIQVINEGKSTDITCNLVFATWQSIFRMPKEWFRQFEMVIGDECHLFAAKSLVSIMEKLDQCPLKFGMTGTLDDSKINGMVLIFAIAAHGFKRPNMALSQIPDLSNSDSMTMLRNLLQHWH